jgi:membrane protein
MRYRLAWNLFRRAFALWNDHDAPRLGAALAFYAILSLAPLAILAMAILSFVLGHSAAQENLLAAVRNMIGAQGAEAVKAAIDHSQTTPASSRLASIIGVVALLFGASGVFVELRAALDKMWDVRSSTVSGIWGAIKDRLLSFGMLLAVGFLLLVSLLISVASAALDHFLEGRLAPNHVLLLAFLLKTIDVVGSLAGIGVLFALTFRYVPAVRIAWRNAWIGAMVTAVLFTIGKFLIGMYLGKAAVGSAYGAAGSLIVVIVWVYYSAMIFLLGAEFTHLIHSPGDVVQEASISPTRRAA